MKLFGNCRGPDKRGGEGYYRMAALEQKRGREDGEAEIDFLLLIPPPSGKDANDCSIESERRRAQKRDESAKNART